MHAYRPDAGPDPVQAKVLTARQELAVALIAREEEVDLAFTALLAQEHALLVGPPGTAKSLLLDSPMAWMQGRKFTILFTKYTMPEEVFGPVSLAGLKADRCVRVTAGKLPEADGAFADEIFRASSAILNTLLRLLNERVYDQGDGVLRPVPLKLFVGAANAWPHQFEGGKELNALFDRFVLRKAVRPIGTAAGRQRLLWTRDHTPRLSRTITPAEIDQAHAAARCLPWSPEAKEALKQILRELAREGVQPGDRRPFKAVGVARAFAYLGGAGRVEPEHLEVLQHVLWDDPEEQPAKVAQVVARVANPAGMRVNQLLLEAEAVLAAADVRQLAQAATATAKLGEIDKQLAALGGHPRAARARAYVEDHVKRIKRASIEAI